MDGNTTRHFGVSGCSITGYCGMANAKKRAEAKGNLATQRKVKRDQC